MRRGISKKVGERQGATDHDYERPVCPVSHPCDCQPCNILGMRGGFSLRCFKQGIIHGILYTMSLLLLYWYTIILSYCSVLKDGM